MIDSRVIIRGGMAGNPIETRDPIMGEVWGWEGLAGALPLFAKDVTNAHDDLEE